MYRYGTLQSSICPSPQADILVFHPSRQSFCVPVAAIIDTGAVMTILPEQIIRDLATISRLGIDPVETRQGTTVTDELFPIPVYQLRLTVIATPNLEVIDTTEDVNITEDISFLNIKVGSIRGKRYAIIGRDILNEKKLVLNAPQNIWGFNCHGPDCGFS